MYTINSIRSMTHTLQFFVYNALDEDNRYPLVKFDTREDAYEFLSRLRSENARRISNEPFLVLNNTQLLPKTVRELHSYTVSMISEDEEKEGKVETREYDGCFSIRRNLATFRRFVNQIDDNTTVSSGFRDYIRSL